jgi:uncharacterized membrane protein YraQ (UPF0718 family)
MGECCEKPVKEKVVVSSCCMEDQVDAPSVKKKKDIFLISTSSIIVCAYLLSYVNTGSAIWLASFTYAVYEIVNTMFWGVAVGIIFIGFISHVPREFVIALLGRGNGISGIFRATMAGVLLDLCSHGILMVGAKLYERGATLGQVMAFLIASPWNSISLTLILWAMIGFKWMLTFLLLSMVIAIISGLIFERLVANGTLPDNPNRMDLPADYDVIREAKRGIKTTQYNFTLLRKTLRNGIIDSRIVIRWIFLGVLLAALVRTFISTEIFQNWFGPTLMGLALTLFAATIIEVCSEGTVPIAADLLTRGAAPGNSFTFLMAGVSTDYTEILVMKETTSSWKIAFFLPLITLPQIILLGIAINYLGV